MSNARYMDKLKRYQLLVSRLENLTEPSAAVNFNIAQLLGWGNIQITNDGYMGVNPKTGEHEFVPKFTHSLDMAITTVPHLWVESYRCLFDGMIDAECHPRSDLKLQTVYGESPLRAVAILICTMKAHLAQFEKKGIINV